MKTWTDFLADLLFSKGKNNWWPLANEALNHSLISILIKYEPRFLEQHLGRGNRKIIKCDFGSRSMETLTGFNVRELDIHVEVAGIVTLIEIKTWSQLSSHQLPINYSDMLKSHSNYKLLYILLTDKSMKKYPQVSSPDMEKSGRVNVMTRSDLIEALDQVSNSKEVGLIASDYARALRLLTVEKGWSR